MLTSVSHAVLQDEIQVYDDEINEKGEYSLELHVNTTPNGIKTPSYRGEVMNAGNTRLTPELAYGLGHGLEAGLYLNTVFNGGNWEYAGYKARLKWLPILEKMVMTFLQGSISKSVISCISMNSHAMRQRRALSLVSISINGWCRSTRFLVISFHSPIKVRVLISPLRHVSRVRSPQIWR